MVGMAEVGAPISQDGMAVHLDCWCICLCYLHFAPENPEDGKKDMTFGITPYVPMQAGSGETKPECSTTLCYSTALC